VQVVTLDLIHPGQHGVEIVGDADMAAGQTVHGAAGQREDQATVTMPDRNHVAPIS
jgi:hypothetical protein